jgi:hypothetical protein
MKRKCEYSPRNVAVPLTSAEVELWDEFLHREGLKRGGWIRKLILDAIARDQAVKSGATQIDPAFFQGGRA